MELTVHHKRQWHVWANQRMRRNWKTMRFSGQSRFTRNFADGRLRVWRRPGERFTEACVMPVDRFGCGSLMVWGAVHYAGKTNLIVIRQTPNAQRYCDGILRPVVAPFMRINNRCIFQQNHTRPHIASLSSNVLLAKNTDIVDFCVNSSGVTYCIP